MIRLAIEGDLAAILRLYQESGLQSDSFTLDEAREQFRLIDRYPNYRIFVAEIDGETAGTYALIILDKLAKRGTTAGIVEASRCCRLTRATSVAR